MNFRPIRVVAGKELKDGLRDRRSLYTILAPILFGPIVLSFMVQKVGALKKSAGEIRIPVSGAESAPALIEWLQQQSGVEIGGAPSDPEAAVLNGQEDVVLIIDKEFPESFGRSKPASVQILSDSTRGSAQPKLTRLKSLLSGFSSEIASLRLIIHGVSPQAINPLKIREVDVSTQEQRAAATFNIVLMFLVVTLIVAGMQIATDSTAGERERNSLEPLLLNPVPRWQLIAGKWFAAAVSAFAGMVACLLIVSAAIARLPLENLAVRFDFNTAKILVLLAAIGPLALLAPAIQTYLSCSARSFKEAQSYTVFLVIPVAFMGVISMWYPVTTHSWALAIPLLAQYSLGTSALGGNIPSFTSLFLTGLQAAVLTAVFLWLAARRFSNERTIFGR